MKYKLLVTSLLSLLATDCLAANPLFSVTPRVNPPTQLYKGAVSAAIYQVTNNTKQNLVGLGVTGLPAGASLMTPPGGSESNYCTLPTFNLNSGGSCLIKLQINSNTAKGNAVSGGPMVCYSSTHPVYCSQPFSAEQLNVQILSTPQPQDCNSNSGNFNNELVQNFDLTTADPTWGPNPNTLAMSSTINQCYNTQGVSWQQQRILAAADFWVKQKLNYCHHYIPDWMTPNSNRGAGQEDGGYCSPKLDLMAGTPYYNQQVRWNYSGNNSETSYTWLNNNYMWYGMDCSNYTRFLYNFAFGQFYTGDTGWQAGQAEDGSQDTLSPNQQTTGNELDNPEAPGKLVCADNTLEVNHSCSGHGGYISVIESDGSRDPSAVTDTMLENLQPGDLLYIAASLEDGSPSSAVTHVVMWTGKTIGDGPNQIPASQIAPDEICPASEWRTSGAWVITDSHYQGADYRAFTPCFYGHNLWGVRRVFGAS